MGSDLTNIKARRALAYDAFQALDKRARRAVFVLDVAVPVVLAGAQEDVFRVGGHGV